MTFDSLDDLKQSKITELPGNVPRYAVAPKPLLDGILSIWSIGFAQGWFDLLSKRGSDRTANEVFPEIDVLKFKDFLNRCWMRG